MKTIQLTTSALIAALALSGCQTPKPAPAAPRPFTAPAKKATPAPAPAKAAAATGDVLVPNLKTATLDQTHKTWILQAIGTVPNSGWSKKGKLVPAYNRYELLKGIYRYDFVATPPAKGAISSQIVTQIQATLPISDPNSRVKIFRIVGGNATQDVKVKK